MITAEYTIPGLFVRDHLERVPLDWFGAPDGETIEVFAREVVATTKRTDDLPLLLFLQGGPGGKSPRPTDASGWLGAMLERYRVVLLDQRGTGRSSRVDGARMRSFPDGEAGADFLAHFRADSIVADAEYLRKTVFAGRRWTTLGQSYGGFLTLTYLSQAPEGLAACLVTGGLASVRPDAAEVYRRCFDRAVGKNRQYAERYPQDVEVVGRIADRLAAGDVRLPDGSPLSIRRFQWLGQDFGMKPSFERMHWLVDEAFASSDGELAETFLGEVYQRTSFADDPLYAAVHEAIYADPESGATGWS
ncbi:MAG: hypothetical protein QOE37_53, partial [Microbacteriaceae bacterium]|nr:hypothetical protein [Microbacteriaceae bacterium]